MSMFWLGIVMLVMLCGVLEICFSLASAVAEQAALVSSDQPLPTERPEPTQTKFAVLVPVIGTVNEEKVNLRSAPSTEADIIGKVEQGDEITLTGQSQDGKWYQIRLADESVGWMFGETLEITSGDPALLEIVNLEP